MAGIDIETISIYENDLNDLDIIRNIINANNQEDAFYIFDIGAFTRQHKQWISTMPKVSPYYAVKCNPNDTAIRVLASLNGKFDCASKQEIEQVMQAGVSSDRIIYANPNKLHSHIIFAKKVGVRTLMIDNSIEVLRIKELYPEAKLVIRLAIENDSSGIKLNKKFGCEATTEVITLMNFVKKQQMHLEGFSFHLGSPCWDPSAYGRAIKICKELIKTAKDMGFNEANLIDIGGGISGTDEDLFHKVVESVNGALENLDPSIKVISEPGRYYVQSPFTLATYIFSKRINDTKVAEKHYFINDGIFGSFIDNIKGLAYDKRMPSPLRNTNAELFQSVVWGPTCSSTDCVIDQILLPDLSIGDWIIWRNMGSYTISIASRFNGYAPPTVFPIIRKSALKELLNDIDTAEKSEAIKSYDKE